MLPYLNQEDNTLARVLQNSFSRRTGDVVKYGVLAWIRFVAQTLSHCKAWDGLQLTGLPR
jgi:uncharacterized membrane protein